MTTMSDDFGFRQIQFKVSGSVFEINKMFAEGLMFEIERHLDTITRGHGSSGTLGPQQTTVRL